MKVEFTETFVRKLNKQVEYIAQDKPSAARKFKNDLLQKCAGIRNRPYSCMQSKYSNRIDVRDLVFKGYTALYKVDSTNDLITFFSFIKYQDGIGDEST